MMIIIIIKNYYYQKVRSVMKWWSKCIPLIIAEKASRNVTFKAAKMSDLNVN